MRSRPCRQVKREEAVVRRNPMDALIRPLWSSSVRWAQPQALQQLAFTHGEIICLYGGQHRPEPTGGAGAEEKEAGEEDWDDERTANGWYESAAFGSAVDPAEGSDAVGGSFGEEIPAPQEMGVPDLLGWKKKRKTIKWEMKRSREEGW